MIHFNLSQLSSNRFSLSGTKLNISFDTSAIAVIEQANGESGQTRTP